MSMTRSELQDAIRKALGDGLAPDADASWATLTELGALMMAVPEELGGLGLGREAAGVIHVELGRSLVRGPAIAQMLVIEALAAAGQTELLERAMGGEMMTASLAGDGSLTCVPDADKASHVLLVEGSRVSLAPMDGAAIVYRETWDRTRRLFDVKPVVAPILLADSAALADRLQGQLLFALAGDSLGGAGAILESTVEYLKTRRQFDRPLALFQALKHRVADMKTWLSAAEALFWSRATDGSGLAELAALKAHAASVYRAIAEDAVQLHGGIGLTMEHHCHLFLKRATLNAALGGDIDTLEEEAGRRMLASVPA